MSSFTGIDIGLRALMAAQASLAAAAANTANASTPGYSRIRARLVDDAPPLTATGANSPGFGVRVDGFERIRDAIVDLQWRAAAAEGGEHLVAVVQGRAFEHHRAAMVDVAVAAVVDRALVYHKQTVALTDNACNNVLQVG
jgi:hypothetical protein